MSSSGTRGTGELVAEMDDAQMEEEEVSDNNVYDHDNHLFICKVFSSFSTCLFWLIIP
jgi:hypothetical protein